MIQRFLKKSPLLRFLLLPIGFLIFSAIISLFVFITQQKPTLDSISPSIGEQGDVIVFRGKHFGSEKQSSWIQISGDRISSNACLSWSDTVILVQLPITAQDGLVYVHNQFGLSNPQLFTNRRSIPVTRRINTESGLPHITSFSSENIEIGKRLVITGKNFGLSRNASMVEFTWDTDSSVPQTWQAYANQSKIACSEHNYDYEIWNDQEITIRVPDGARSGNVYVTTDRGTSNGKNIQIVSSPGTKKFSDYRTYLLTIDISITNISASDGNLFHIRVPKPQESSSLRSVKITNSKPLPFMDEYKGSILHQIENLRSGRNESLSHSFLINNYSVETSINPSQVKSYSDTSSPFYTMFTGADALIPSNNPIFLTYANEITGKEKNPWKKAKLIYEWILASIIYEKNNGQQIKLEEIFDKKRGDAYDMALLFTALCRASGIPSLPVAGVLVDTNRNSLIHWWAEFYIENFGWIPVDPALALGNPVAIKTEGAAQWYFGNLDAQHIAFSRGWMDQKPMTANSKIVAFPRSFAFLPIWEEASGSIKAYTSYWTEPQVTGVY